MPGPTSDAEIGQLVAAVVEAFPALAGARFEVLAEGWDSIALDVDDRLIFKFPRHEAAERALRREAAFLEVIGATVTMPVPRLELFETPRLFSRHPKLAGNHLLSGDYAALPEAKRAALGEALGQFYAELHTIPPSRMEALGALPLVAWPAPDDILARAWPHLASRPRQFAERTIADFAALPPDPCGIIYGYFDGHGWNMAFDHVNGRLNGLYDFADSGLASLHRDFIYSNFIATDLTERIITVYERETARRIDRARVATLTGAHRLWELAVEAENPEERDGMLRSLVSWIEVAGEA